MKYKEYTVSTYNRASDVCMYVCMYVCIYVCIYVSHVLDTKLLERLMSPKSQVMFASAFSWIGDFFEFLGFIFFKFGEFSLRFTAAMSDRWVSKKAAHYIILK